jgi:hypothetical protein
MEKIVHRNEKHIVYWNLDGCLFWEGKHKKKIFCPVNTRTQLTIDLETQPSDDEFTLIRKNTHCSKCDSEER